MLAFLCWLFAMGAVFALAIAPALVPLPPLLWFLIDLAVMSLLVVLLVFVIPGLTEITGGKPPGFDGL